MSMRKGGLSCGIWPYMWNVVSQGTAYFHTRNSVYLCGLLILMCYNLFPGRPDKAGAKIDNNCCRANLSREHVGSLLLDQWVKDKHVKGCIRLEVCKLTRKGLKDST
jgi:hypothetical protein